MKVILATRKSELLNVSAPSLAEKIEILKNQDFYSQLAPFRNSDYSPKALYNRLFQA